MMMNTSRLTGEILEFAVMIGFWGNRWKTMVEVETVVDRLRGDTTTSSTRRRRRRRCPIIVERRRIGGSPPEDAAPEEPVEVFEGMGNAEIDKEKGTGCGLGPVEGGAPFRETATPAIVELTCSCEHGPFRAKMTRSVEPP